MRAPTTSRVLLALGALTLVVLAGSLLTSTGTDTAAAHEPDTPPDPDLVGAEEGPCKGAAKTAYGEATAPTLGDNKKCVEGQSKEKWYHQNYWFPCVGTSTTNCVLDKTAEEDEYETHGHKWHEVTLRHFTSSPLDVLPGALTAYLNEVEDNHPLWERSWCGVGNVNGDNAKPFDLWKNARDANCGHTGNRPHGYFDHQPTAVTVRTRTVYVDTHNHCDDGTHPSDHDNDTCPEDDGCKVKPGVPRNARRWSVNKLDGTERVSWGTPASDGDAGTLCNVTYVVRVSDANAAPGTEPRVHRFSASDTRSHKEPHATAATGVKTVNIHAVNEHDESDPATVLLHPRCVEGTTHEWKLITSTDVGGTEAGCNNVEPPTTCPPGTTHAGKLLTDPAVGGTVEGCNDDRCPLPAAPTVTKHNKRDGPPPEQLVRWEITNPPVSPCEVTGWLIYYGTDAARSKSAATTSSWERKPVPGSRIRVFVRAENPVDPDDRNGTKQLSNAGSVDLYGDCPAGTTHAGKPMDDPAVGGTVEGCNNEPPPGVCPLPAAPVLTSDPEDTDSSRLVTWTVADPVGADCEITGQELRRVPQRGISSTRPRDQNTRESTQSVTARTGAVVVSVRAKNRVQSGSSTEQWGGWGQLVLDWDAPACAGPPGRPDPGYVEPNVSWVAPSAGGANCSILEYRIVRVPAGELGLPAVTQPADERSFEVPRPAAGQGDTVVRVAARNEHSWGRDGTVVVAEEQASACATAPDTPVLSERRRSRGQVPVSWRVRSDGGHDCTLIAYEVDVEGEPVESFAGRGRTHRITEPAARESVLVEVRVRNEFGWSDWGWLTVGGGCTVPEAPYVGVGDPYQRELRNGRQSRLWSRDVFWSEADDGGCSITRHQKSGWGGTVWIRNPLEEEWEARVPHPASGSVTVRVRARNAVGWGPWGEAEVEACLGVPTAPTVRGRQVYGGGHQLAVSWSSGEEGGWCPNNRYEGRLVGGTSWREYNRNTRSRDLQWQPSVTETPVVRVRASNPKGWGPWGEGTFTVCPAAPATPEVTVSDRAAHADEWGTPGAATKVSWAYTGTGGQHCTITLHEYETTDSSYDMNQLLRTFDPDDNEVRWSSGRLTRYGWIEYATRAWDGTLEWLEPNVTTRTAPVAVRVRARNQFGWGEWGTNQLALPEVPESCTGPPGAPVLTVGQPHHVPDASMDWFSEVVRNGWHTRRWVTVSWDAIHDGGWTCEILSMDADSWETLPDDAPEWETGFRWRYTLAPDRRSVNVVYPEPGGVTTVWVWATNQFGRGATGSVRIIYAEQPACTLPPHAPRVATHGFHADSTPNVRYYTIDDDHPGSGGEHCQIIRYEHEHQTATGSAVYADTNVHRLPGFGRIWETVNGLPALGTATGDLTVRVRAVNQHGPGPWREVPIEAVCPDDTPLAGERMEGLPATGCGTNRNTVDPAACDNFYAFSEVYTWSYLWEVVDPWWDSLTAEQAVGWGLPYTEKGLSTAMAKCLIVAIG